MSEPSNSIQVILITNTGNGGGSFKTVPHGTTVADLLKDMNTANATVRVNRASATPDTPLADGDQVSVAPNKVTGA